MLHFGLILGFVHRTQHSGSVEYSIASTLCTTLGSNKFSASWCFLPGKMHHYRFERGRETQAVTEERGTYIPVTIMPCLLQGQRTTIEVSWDKKKNLSVLFSIHCVFFSHHLIKAHISPKENGTRHRISVVSLCLFAARMVNNGLALMS